MAYHTDPLRPNTAVLLIPYTSPTLKYSPYADLTGNTNVVEWFARWVSRFHPSFQLVVALNSEGSARVLGPIAKRAQATPFRLSSRSKLPALIEIADASGAQHVAMLPIGLPLCPAELLGFAWRHHHSAENHSTLVADLPRLFAPQIYSREGLEILASIPAAGVPLEPADLAQRCLGIQNQPGQQLLLRASPLWALRCLPIKNSDIPFGASFQNEQDLALFRAALSTEEPQTASFRDGEGLRHMKRLLISETERRRSKDFALRRPRRAASLPRVLFVSNTSAFSGSEEVLCTIAENIDRRRFTASALVGGAGHLSDRLANSVTTVFVPELDFSKPTLRSLETACSTLNETDPDIVHCNGAVGFPFVAALKLRGTPWVQHAHTVDLHALAEQCLSSDAIVAVSEFVAHHLNYLDVDPARVRLIRNCVDTTTRFVPGLRDRWEARQRLGLPAEPFIAIYPARISALKGHLTLLAALARVLRRDSDVHLVLAGEAISEPEHYDALHQFAESQDLTAHITEIPFVPDMPALYAAADALVFPAEYEPLGLCILEAMAMGVPVIASRSGGIPEIVDHERTGLLVDPRQPEAIEEALLRMMRDLDLRRTLSNAGIEYVRVNHSVSRFARSIEDLYSEILQLAASRKA